MANFVLNSTNTPNKRPPTLQEDDEISIGSVSNNNNKINSSFDVEDISMEEDDAIAAAAATTTTNLAESLATKVNGYQVAQRLYSLAPTINQRLTPASYSAMGSRQPSSASLPTSPTLSRKLASPSVYNSQSSSASKRHYKKDSCYVLDLYTLTFDEDESVDDVQTRRANENNNEYGSIALPSLSFSVQTNESSGPMSLQSTHSQAAVGGPPHSMTTAYTLPSLETNLHKILARKIQDSEEITFRKAKLLTKAYYKLLRESTTPLVDPQVQVLQHRVHHSRAPGGPQSGAFGTKRLTWQELLSTDSAELKRIVGGLGNTVRALNDYLVELLQERDDLLSKQDEMLEEISELTDNLL